MFGAALRLLAVGEAGRRMGDYMQTLVTRYLVLSVAGMSFLGATIFAILAVFWALTSRNIDPVTSAWIMVGILVLLGLLIALIAYGITRRRQPSVQQALTNPAEALRANVPSVEDVSHQIEHAVRRYGPVRVTAAAAAGGLVAGLLAKKFRQI